MNYEGWDYESDNDETDEERNKFSKRQRKSVELEETEAEVVESGKEKLKNNEELKEAETAKSQKQPANKTSRNLAQRSLFNWITPKDKSVKSEREKKENPELPVIVIDNDEVEMAKEPAVQRHYTLTIQGIKVEMPVKPYPCQEEVISSIISGCNTEQNCLLESPTGSGKTLALLCGSLAWQNDFQRKLLEAKRLEESLHQAGTSATFKLGKEGSSRSGGNCCEIDECDLTMFGPNDWDDDNMSDYKPRTKNKRVPKIYYGSRTHRQIGQVIKELKKTVYRDKRMTVLSSREFSCIQETNRNKTELCAELLDPAKKLGCPFYNENKKNVLGSYGGLAQNGVESPWDIEDLVAAGKETKACPYFAARSLMQEAEIIFCPYNYLIDPAIRETLQLDVSGDIIILDEAHNVEDFCRGAGSVSLRDSILEAIIDDCTSVHQFAALKKRLQAAAYATMIGSYCQSVRKFIQSTGLNHKKGAYDATSSDQWTGTELLAIFDMNQISQSDTNNFIRAAREAIFAFNCAKEDIRQGKTTSLPTVSADTIRKLEMILMALNMVTTPQYAVDYRAVVMQVTLGFKKEKSLEFMCMNPAVVFGPLCAMTRCIVLASGTLAPTSSFASELGVKFPFTIQANHVTPQEQICIKCVPNGPKGKPLRATFGNVNTWGFQDDIGAILCDVCEVVPHGVLMFFSSYTVMKSLTDRWESNGMMKKLRGTKRIFFEERGSSQLNSLMTNYRDVIKNTSNGPLEGIDGAIFFAVFRGKVAEGIDFSDNEARAVLTVGIPFSVRSDPAVDMKFRYNDANKERGLLSGYEWYTCQAFRALNQAAGRVIRHKGDWGAILLIDERLLDHRYKTLLSTWVQSMCLAQRGPQPELRKLLRDFVAKQKKRDQEGNPKLL